MPNYFVGEPGYEADLSFETMEGAERAAIDISSKKEYTAISIWDISDDALAVAINGEMFIKRDS